MLSLDMELENRLINWSYWMIDFKEGRLGYPSKSTIADFGLVDSHVRQSRPPFPLNNLLADELNGWINIMAIEHPEYRTTLCAYYMRAKGLRIWELAQDFKISPRMFKQRLHDARLWLTGRLSIEVKNKD